MGLINLTEPKKNVEDVRAEQRLQKVAGLKRLPTRIFKQLFEQWEQGINAIWNDENVQDLFTKLGTDGGLLIQHSRDLVGFLESQVPGCTDKVLEKVKPFIVDERGNVTIVK